MTTRSFPNPLTVFYAQPFHVLKVVVGGMPRRAKLFVGSVAELPPGVNLFVPLNKKVNAVKFICIA